MRDLRIHQVRMRCLTVEAMTQHTETTSSETQEEPGLEETHSIQSLQVLPTPTASTPLPAPSPGSAHSLLAPTTSAGCNAQSLQSHQAPSTSAACAPLAQPRIQLCLNVSMIFAAFWIELKHTVQLWHCNTYLSLSYCMFCKYSRNPQLDSQSFTY